MSGVTSMLSLSRGVRVGMVRPVNGFMADGGRMRGFRPESSKAHRVEHIAHLGVDTGRGTSGSSKAWTAPGGDDMKTTRRALRELGLLSRYHRLIPV